MFAERRFHQIDGVLNSAGFEHNLPTNPTESLSLSWKELCRRYLPVVTGDPIWRYSRLREPQDPEQGWKLHVSATILTAVRILEIVAPFLENQKALYKAPVSLKELKKINSGVYYDYTQIGKFITIYPRNDEQAVYFAERLHQLTYQIPAPSIPFDSKFKPEGCVYYRYGAFRVNEITQSDGTFILAMRDPQGNLIPDARNNEKPFPDWVTNPFARPQDAILPTGKPLKEGLKVLRALSQRGKGGVYQGIDFSADTPRFCLLKEGRKNGEVEWDGRDGFWRLQNEERVLNALGSAGIKVPQIYSSFIAENNYYLMTEYIAGETLHVYLQKRKRRLSTFRALKYAIQLAEQLAKVHSAGWIWRDCKPDNLILTKKRHIRLLDFEGACPVNQPDPTVWSTLIVDSPAWFEKNSGQFALTADLFALGAIIYLLFEGKLPIVTEDSIPKISRRKVPPEIVRLTSRLLNPNAAKCFDAQAVVRKLKAIQKTIKSQSS
jgi:serine/threonine protein kinase